MIFKAHRFLVSLRSRSVFVPFLLLPCLTVSLHALVLDNFSSTSTITTSAESGATIDIVTVSGTGGNAIRLDYDLGTGSWVQYVKDYASFDFDKLGGNSLRFRLRASGNQNTLEIKFSDFDSTSSVTSDKLDLRFLTTPDGSWRTFTIPFSSFTMFADGNASFDLSQVSKMAFGTLRENSSAGSGTVWIDRVELFKATSTLVDNFDDGAEPNFLGGNNVADPLTGSGGLVTLLAYALGGIQLGYDVTAGGSFAGMVMNLQGKNFQGYTHLSFRIRGNAGGEVMAVKLENVSGQSQELVATHLTGGITTSFQEVQIPLTAFEGISFSTVSKFVLITENSFASAAGTVFLDDLAFIRAGETPAVVHILDDMDTDFSQSNWEKFTHEQATLETSVITDQSAPDAKQANRVYRLDYTLNTDPEVTWVIIERPFYFSILPFSSLRFRYKGTGSSNNVEFKMTDNDGTVWVRNLKNSSNTNGAWKLANVPLTQFSFFGAASSLDLKKIQKIGFAISKGDGGSGSFTVDTIEAPVSGESEQVNIGSLVTSFRVENNPFSPNGDGVKDQTFFTYSLTINSKVNLKIYNLEGDVVKTVADQDQTAGNQSLMWDGFDKNNEKVRNGLYICRFEVEGVDGRNEDFKQILAVIR